MRPILAPVLLLAVALPAQGTPEATPKDPVPQLRAAFAAANKLAWAVVIAVVPGHEPVLLTSGNDAAGNDLTPQTVVPMLALAKVLAADAIHVQLAGKIDRPSGEKLGERELTVRELLDGAPQLPDFYVLDGGDDAVDADLLRRCGTMAVRAQMELQGGRLGAAEFVLLESLALGRRHKDWPAMLRVTLAPHVPGLDPISADSLEEPARGRTILAPEELAKLAKARPAVLRTMLTLQNLGTWMQWRTQQTTPLWTSARMGRIAPALTKQKDETWMAGTGAYGSTMSLVQHPSGRAALLWIVPTAQGTLVRQLRGAFENDLYGADASAEAPAELLGGVLRAKAAAGARPEASAPAGKRWASAAVDGKTAVKLAFGATANEPVAMAVDGEALTLSMARSGDGLRATPVGRGNAMYRLWLYPEPDADKPTQLTGVLVVTRGTAATAAAGAAPGSGGGAALPRYFELLPEND